MRCVNQWNGLLGSTILNLWISIRILKIGLRSVGKMYIVSALLRNAHACFNAGNQTSEYFNLEPTTLEEYFVWDSTQYNIFG